MKKLFIMVSALALVFSTIITASAAGEKAMTKAELIDMALKNNQQISLYNTSIDIAQKKHLSVMYDIDIWNAKEPEEKSGTSTRVQNARVHDYYPKLSTKNINELKDKKLIFEKTLKIDVEEKYYDYLVLNSKETAKRQYLDKLDKEKLIVKKRIELGQINSSELTNIETKIIRGEVELATIIGQKKSTEMEMELLVGKDVDMTKIAKADMPKATFKTIELGKIMDKYVANHPEIYWRNESLKLEKINYDISEKYRNLRSLQAEVLTMENTMENLNYELQDNTIKLKNNLTKSYNNLMQAKNEFEMQGLKVKYQDSLLKAALAKKGAGMITEIEYLEEKQAYDEADILLKEKQLDFYILLERFNKDIEDRASLSFLSNKK